MTLSRIATLILGVALMLIKAAGSEAGAPRQNPTPPAAGGTLNLPDGIKMDFVNIAPGRFVMGCSDGDTQCDKDERPAHPVRISKGFELGKYEVTQEQWFSVMMTDPGGSICDDCAVQQVSWNDTQEFIRKLNAKNDGFRYRLPTEAEWEYAARAGTTGKYPGELDAIAWYESNSKASIHPVGKKQANAWGLYDILGNVAEWVQDRYDHYPEGSAVDPMGAEMGEERSVRGGAWDDTAKGARVSARDLDQPKYKDDNVGFRVARQPAAP